MGSLLPTSPGISNRPAPQKATASTAPKKQGSTAPTQAAKAMSFQSMVPKPQSAPVKAAAPAKPVASAKPVALPKPLALAKPKTTAPVNTSVSKQSPSAQAASQVLASRANSASAANSANAAQSATRSTTQAQALPADRVLSSNPPSPASAVPATKATPAPASNIQVAAKAKAQSSKAYAAVSPNYTVMQQNWLDANAGPISNLMVNSLNRTEPYSLVPLPLQWANISGGGTYGSYRAVGTVTPETAKELASLMGGQVADSPFGTYGTETRDTYIRMPSGQMIDAAVLASNLNAARESRDPFSALQAMLDVYQGEAKQYNWNRSTDAIDNVNGGRFGRATPVLPT